MTASRRIALSALALVLFAAPSVARADDSTTDQTLAQSLFDEAVRLMDAGRFSDACPKLAESERLDPGGGTLLNLGFCREKEGKLASAWAAYNEALSRAIKDGRADREKAARVHVDELESKTAKLSIDVSDAAKRTDGLAIRIDDSPVRQAAWGVLMPIDRGDHPVVVTAPGKREFKTTVSVPNDGVVQHVTIPALENAPVVVRHDALGSERRSSSQATVGWITGAVGLAFVGVGIGAGVAALAQHSESNDDCPNGQCTLAGVQAEDRAKTFAWISDFGVGIGAAAVVTGLVLVLTAPRSGARVVPVVSAHGAGAAFAMRF